MVKVLGSGIEGSVDGGRMPQAQRAWVLEQVRLADEGKPSVFPKDRSETIIIACSDGSSAEVTRLTLESLGYTTACNAGSWARYEASRGAKNIRPRLSRRRPLANRAPRAARRAPRAGQQRRRPRRQRLPPAASWYGALLEQRDERLDGGAAARRWRGPPRAQHRSPRRARHRAAQRAAAADGLDVAAEAGRGERRQLARHMSAEIATAALPTAGARGRRARSPRSTPSPRRRPWGARRPRAPARQPCERGSAASAALRVGHGVSSTDAASAAAAAAAPLRRARRPRRGWWRRAASASQPQRRASTLRGAPIASAATAAAPARGTSMIAGSSRAAGRPLQRWRGAEGGERGEARACGASAPTSA